MGEETTRLENEIRHERAGLADSIQALEAKAVRAKNWRYQFAKRPAAGLGIALVGGFALAKIVSGGRGHADDAEPSNGARHGAPANKSARRGRKSRSSGLVSTLQAAVVGIVAQELRSFLRTQVFSFGQRGPERSEHNGAQASPANSNPDT